MKVMLIQGLRAPLLLTGLLLLSIASTASEVIPGSKLKVHYLWKTVDFVYPNSTSRQEAIDNGDFIPENSHPLGVDVWQDRIFVTFPKWKKGIPATLAVIPRNPTNNKGNRSPPFRPYPDWTWHTDIQCNGITSVFRTYIDPCGKLWIADSGATDISNDEQTQTCSPQLLVFDLRRDNLILRYKIPDSQVKQGSLFSNIIVDTREEKCEDTYAYISDVARYGLVVYSSQQNTSWRINHNFFYPDPIASRYNLHDITWRWTDGILGMALSPFINEINDRIIFFHPMSSFREFAVRASYVRNKTLAEENPDAFTLLGEPRAIMNGQSSGEAMDRKGVLFFNLVTRDSIGCWNSRQPYGYVINRIAIVGFSIKSLNFPNDIKIDHEMSQNLWVLSNKLQQYLYGELDFNVYNFRIITAPTDELVQGTICD